VFGEWPVCTVVLVGEKMGSLQRLVDAEMVGKGSMRISWPFLLGPENCLALFFLWNDFGVWNVEGGNCVTVPVLYIVAKVCDLDMCVGVEAVEVSNCELVF